MIIENIRSGFMRALMRLDFDLNKRLKFYRIMNKATDERRHGVRVKQVLEHLMRLEKSAHKNSITYKMYRNWVQLLTQGKDFGAILANYVPQAEAMIISASEMSGKISDGFLLASEVARTQADFRKVFRTALIGPIAILLTTMGVMSFFCTNIFPAISQSLEVNQMSSLSQFVVKIVNGYMIWFPTTLMILVGLVAFVMWAMPNYKAGLRSQLERIPPFSLYRIFIGCSFLHAFNALTKAGVQQVKALQKMSEFATPYLKYRINRIVYFMNRGASFGHALISCKLNFPDREVIDELSMHADTGSIDSVLDEIVKDLNTDGLELIKLQAGVARYVCTAITVVVVLFLMLSLFSFVKDMQATTMH